MRQFRVEARRLESRQRGGGVLWTEEIQLAIGEIVPVLSLLEQLRVDGRDFRRALEASDVGVDEVGVVADAVRRIERDIEMIQAAEVLQELLKVADGARVPRQQAKDVGVERRSGDEPDADRRRDDCHQDDRQKTPSREGAHGRDEGGWHRLIWRRAG